MTQPLDPKVLNQQILDSLKDFREQAKLLLGRRIRITAFYNGQPMGLSKPNLQGTEMVIRSVGVSEYGLSIIPEGHRTYMHIGQWELLP